VFGSHVTCYTDYYHSLTPVGFGMWLVYQVTYIIPYKESRGRGMTT